MIGAPVGVAVWNLSATGRIYSACSHGILRTPSPKSLSVVVVDTLTRRSGVQIRIAGITAHSAEARTASEWLGEMLRATFGIANDTRSNGDLCGDYLG
jgi:hypothetical protein